MRAASAALSSARFLAAASAFDGAATGASACTGEAPNSPRATSALMPTDATSLGVVILPSIRTVACCVMAGLRAEAPPAGLATNAKPSTACARSANAAARAMSFIAIVGSLGVRLLPEWWTNYTGEAPTTIVITAFSLSEGKVTKTCAHTHTRSIPQLHTRRE